MFAGTGLIEQDTGMLYAPGSLMIDCFLRENYTTDSNVMMPGVSELSFVVVFIL